MSEWQTFYHGTEASCESLAAALHSNGVHVVKNADRGSTLTKSGYREYLYRLDVPTDEIEAANGVRSTWEVGQADRARKIAGSIYRVFLASFILPAFWLGCHFLKVPATPKPTAPLIGVLWLVGLVAAGQLENRGNSSGTSGNAA